MLKNTSLVARSRLVADPIPCGDNVPEDIPTCRTQSHTSLARHHKFTADVDIAFVSAATTLIGVIDLGKALPPDASFTSCCSPAACASSANGQLTRRTHGKGNMANLAADADHAESQFAATMHLMGATFKNTSPAAHPGLANRQLPMTTLFGNPSSKATSWLAADPIYDGDGPPKVHTTRS